jgi:hypothetical protein
MRASRGRRAERRDSRPAVDKTEGSSIRHLASPRLARIILVTLSERAPLSMIQQITPSTTTARKRSAAIAGTPSLTRSAAGSTPAAARPTRLSTPLTMRRPYDAVIGARRPKELRRGPGAARTAAASGNQPRTEQDPIAHCDTLPHTEPDRLQAGRKPPHPPAHKQTAWAGRGLENRAPEPCGQPLASAGPTT